MIDANSINRVVTVSTHDENYAAYFDESCKRYGIDPIILGKGTPWLGYGTKLRLLKEYVDTCDDEIVLLFVDRFDLIFLRELDPLFTFYRSQCEQKPNVDLLYISTEKPDIIGLNSIYATFHWGKYKDVALNTGSYIATAGMIKKMLQEVYSSNSIVEIKDDQEMITRYLCLHSDVEVLLDHNRRFLVYSAFRLDIGKNIHIEDEKLLYRLEDGTCYRPYLLHRNGSPPMSQLLLKLGYDIRRHQIPSTHLKRIFTNHIPHLINRCVEKILPRLRYSCK